MHVTDREFVGRRYENRDSNDSAREGVGSARIVATSSEGQRNGNERDILLRNLYQRATIVLERMVISLVML
jgi:hypothetical protein